MASNLIVARGGVDVPPISLAFWRWLLAFLILFMFTNKEIIKKKNSIYKELYPLFFLGITSASICGAFPFIAGSTTTVINMGIIYSSSPVFIVIFSYILFSSKLTKIQLLGFILSLLGVLLVICRGNLKFILLFQFNEGDLWILGAAISWALYSVYQIKFKTDFSIFARVTLIALFGSIALIPFLFIEKNLFFAPSFDKNFLFWIVFAAISPSIIAFYLYAKLQKVSGANIAGLAVYLYPIYGAYFGYIFFNESLEVFHLFGSALVFLGVLLATKFKKHS